jgi:phosphoribosylaminoimidazole carboxylase PurE protein
VSAPLVVILMGSKADEAHCAKIAAALTSLGVESQTRVGSAHKTPAHVSRLLEEYEASGRPRVYITVAGRSNALSGFADGSVDAPVIACPPPSEAFGGADLYSSIRMPSGVAPALVLDPANAALLAAKILGLVDSGLAERVRAFRADSARAVLEADASLTGGSAPTGDSPRGRLA